MSQQKSYKVETGLRIPEGRYNELVRLAQEMGVSLNALILMLVDLGLGVRNGRIPIQQEVR